MILATHALAGAAIGKHIENPWLVVVLSIFLHFVLDTFRHGEYLNQNSKMREFWKVILDLAIGLTIISIIIFFSDFSQANMKNVLLGVFFSLLPDFLTLLNWKLGVKFLKKYYDFHNWLHKYPRFSKERDFNLRNGINDIIFSLAAIIFLLLK